MLHVLQAYGITIRDNDLDIKHFFKKRQFLNYFHFIWSAVTSFTEIYKQHFSLYISFAVKLIVIFFIYTSYTWEEKKHELYSWHFIIQFQGHLYKHVRMRPLILSVKVYKYVHKLCCTILVIGLYIKETKHIILIICIQENKSY